MKPGDASLSAAEASCVAARFVGWPPGRLKDVAVEAPAVGELGDQKLASRRRSSRPATLNRCGRGGGGGAVLGAGSRWWCCITACAGGGVSTLWKRLARGGRRRGAGGGRGGAGWAGGGVVRGRGGARRGAVPEGR